MGYGAVVVQRDRYLDRLIRTRRILIKIQNFTRRGSHPANQQVVIRVIINVI